MEKPPIPEATLGDFLLWLLGRRKRMRVTGESMTPTLNEDDLLFVDRRAYRSDRAPQPGDIVVALHPAQQELRLIKRVAYITEEGRVFLISDNPGVGADSRTFGPVSHKQVLGKVVCRVV